MGYSRNASVYILFTFLRPEHESCAKNQALLRAHHAAAAVVVKILFAKKQVSILLTKLLPTQVAIEYIRSCTYGGTSTYVVGTPLSSIDTLFRESSANHEMKSLAKKCHERS